MDLENILYLSESKVIELLDWNETFCAVEAALKGVSAKKVCQNPRDFTTVLGTKNLLLYMGGYLEDGEFGALGCKLVTAFSNNSKLEKPLPTIMANICLFDDQTGALKTIVAGTEITKWRTAAASAVATRYIYLGNKENKCDTLAILGAGAQGKIHAIAFHHFFNFREIRIWNHNPERAEALVLYLNENVAKDVFKAFTSNEECVRNADVIVTATFASEPILKLDWVKEGAHINAVGAGTNHHCELEEAIYLTADVFIDHWASAKKELTGLETLGVKFKGEVGQLMTGEIRSADIKGITVFQSLGIAVEDCAMAKMIYDRYLQQQQRQ